MLEKILLSGTSWFLAADPRNAGESREQWQAPDWFLEHEQSLVPVVVPSSWQVCKGLERYEGICWYFTRISRTIFERLLPTTNYAELHFNGVNYLARIWLNGIEIGSHEGGFTPFSFHLPQQALKQVLEQGPGDMILAARVDNTRRHDQVPEFSTDWFQWGGIYRDVFIDVKPGSRVARCAIMPHLSYSSKGRVSGASINASVLASAGLKVTWKIKGLDDIEIATGNAAMPMMEYSETGPQLLPLVLDISIPKPRLWSPGTPALYELLLFDDEGDLLYSSRFGLREIKACGPDILLNGTKILLKGASLHEEKFPWGREYPPADRREDIAAMKALGFNFLRTAHYSHDESLIETCDELGMLVGEEIPVYWNVEFRNPKTIRLAARMMRDLIHRDFNHPSVIWWSAGNEVPVSRRDCVQFMTTIMKLAKRLDPSRFSVFVSKAFLYDPARRWSDLTLVNAYFGWYLLTERLFSFVADVVHGTTMRKPFIISEFGANAMLGFGRREAVDVKSSEWKQASIVSHAIKTFNSKSYLSGWVEWIYRDFKSHMRLGKYEQGYNRKGLVDEHGRKKLLALWMPRLVNDRLKYNGKSRILAGILLAKLAWFPLAFAGIVMDVISPLVMKHMNTGYYVYEPRSS
ncbi:MAG TPA: glycoside hydrolase family 2 TIM barrel-domain containing protein [Candidatus Lokiarchaeia archaeon]|nr:glycoside hydrolase family 2 TIM barrel-domain containing protein [Candidatus Lokiarchaeia archaeon]